jgi:hypothetical protein
LVIFTSASNLVSVLVVVEGPTVGSGGAGSTDRSGFLGSGEWLVFGSSGRDEGERDEGERDDERGFEFPGPGPACVPRNSVGLEVMILGLTCGNASRHVSEACL